MFRQLHRWTSLPLILFLIIVLGSGVLLQFEEIGKLGGGERGAAPAQSAASPAMPSDAAIAAQLAEALAKARAAQPGFTPTRIELNIAQGAETTRLARQPRGGAFVEVDHAKDTVKAEMNPTVPLHVTLIRLHTGSMAGAAGVWIMLLSSFVLLFLAVSGGVLYWQMWRHRSRIGRPGVFWK